MIRTRVSAAAAVLALVAATVFVGALAAHAVVNTPVITTPSAGTVNQTPLISGTVDNPDALDITVEVTVTNSGGTATYCVASVPYFSAPVGEPWSCSGAALPYGANTFTAVMWEDFDPGVVSGTSNATVLTIGGTQPAAILSPAPAAVTADATPAFSGTGPSVGSIDVNDGAGTSYCVAAVDALGNWACDAATPLPAAVYNVQADPTWVDGTPDAATVPQTLETVAPPAPTVDQLFVPWVTSETSRAVQGNKDADVDYLQVYVSPDGVTWTPYCQTNGTIGATVWFCNSPFGALTLGTNFVAAIAFNEASDASVIGPSITIDQVLPPTLSAPTQNTFTSDSTPTFSGNSASGTTQTVWESSGPTMLCSSPIVAGAYSCDSTPLADGTYNVFVLVSPGDAVVSATRTFTVDTIAPGAPTITSPTTTTSRYPVISGTAEPFATVSLYRNGSPAACLAGTIVASSSGAWSCATTTILAVGSTYGFSAVQTDRAGNASHLGVPTPQRYITVVAPPVAEPTPLLREPWTFDFGIDGAEFNPGDTTRVTGSGLPPGAKVDIEFHSDPVLLGTTVAGDDGTFGMTVTIPEDADPGEHHFVVVVTPIDDVPSVREQAVMVRAPIEPVEEEVPEDGGTPGGGIDRSDPAAPSSLTTSLDTLADILRNPILIAGAALAGLALLLFVAFPAELLNATISEQYPRFARRIPTATWLERVTRRLDATPIVGAIAVTVAAAVIFGFVDPGFGFEVTSLRVVLACGIALFIVGYLASWIAGRIVGRRWQVRSVIEIKPLGLILAVVGVALSRVLEFSPGFLIGLLIGVGLVGRTTAAQQATAALVRAGVVFGLSLLGWLGYSILMATMQPDSFAAALAFETMVAVTTEGLTVLFVGLLPFKFLDGAVLFAHSKVVWAVSYAVVALAFVLIVIPSAWGEPGGSLWLWVAVVGGFAVVAVGIYLYFRFVAKPIEDADADEPALEGVR